MAKRRAKAVTDFARNNLPAGRALSLLVSCESTRRRIQSEESRQYCSQSVVAPSHVRCTK